MELVGLAYASDAVSKFDKEALKDLCVKASKFNEENGITGFLRYKQNTFFQFIEGEQSKIEKLFASISKDTRHRITNYVNLPNIGPDRCFPEWGMQWISYEDLGVSLEDAFEYAIRNLTERVYDEESRQRTITRLVNALAEAYKRGQIEVQEGSE